MKCTLRLKDDRYIDVEIDRDTKTLTFYSPIPEITRDDLTQLSDESGYTIILTITQEVIQPSIEPNFEQDYTLMEALSLLIYVNEMIITEY